MTTVLEVGQNLVVVLHTGPPGPAGANGVSGEVSSDTGVSLDGEVVLFSGTTGIVIKRSNVLFSALATTAALANKVDKVTGYALSKNDLSDALLAKLNALSTGTFRGTYDDLAALEGTVPIGNEGDYAYVVDPTPPGNEQQEYIWDEPNQVWTPVALGSTPYTGAEIKAVLVAEADTNLLTDAQLAMVLNSVQQSTFDSVIATLTGSASTTLRTPIDDSTTARTLTPADASKIIRLTNVGSCAITLQDDATAPWATFVEIYFVVTTVAPTLILDPGVTANFSALLAGLVAGDTFMLKRIGVDTWDVYAGI